MDLSRFTPAATGTPQEARPERWPSWWWSRLEISANTHRSFGHTAPRTRGWLHLVAAVVWPVQVVRMVLLADTGTAVACALAFGLAMQSMFTASAITHLKRWSVWTTEVMFRFDHTGIFLAIGGTTTAVALLALDGWMRVVVITLMSALMLGGIGIALWPKQTPVGFGNTAFIGGSALVVPFIPVMASRMGWVGTALLVSGGLTYIVGAVLLSFQRPRLSEEWFGYHEVWHLLVVLGVLQNAVMIERHVLPLA